MISDKRLAQLCTETYTEPLTYKSDGVSFRVTKEDEYTVIAFRGSITLLDWVRDFMILPWHGAEIGYQIDAQEAWARVPGEGQIILTGHSKGATDAQLTAYQFIKNGKIPVKLSTFGTPRLVKNLDDEIAVALRNILGNDYRYGDDPVPTLPPSYLHPRGLVQLGSTGFILRPDDHHMNNYVGAL